MYITIVSNTFSSYFATSNAILFKLPSYGMLLSASCLTILALVRTSRLLCTSRVGCGRLSRSSSCGVGRKTSVSKFEKTEPNANCEKKRSLTAPIWMSRLRRSVKVCGLRSGECQILLQINGLVICLAARPFAQFVCPAISPYV